MRIRTVKPEFWTHPITGRAAPELQAFCISLLNYADDDGYFMADPASVRSAVRPFDESSTNCRRLLDDASRIGWCEVRIHPTHGAIGYIPTFVEHQRIDRGKPSKIKQYWDVAIDDESTTNRRSVDDESTLEQGTGNREQGKERNREGVKVGGGALLLQELWNQHKAPEMPKWVEVSPSRRKHADARLRERPIEQWEAIIKRIASSSFCRGLGGKGWKADPDFLLRPDTATKVLEGKYDDPAPKASGAGPQASMKYLL